MNTKMNELFRKLADSPESNYQFSTAGAMALHDYLEKARKQPNAMEEICNHFHQYGVEDFILSYAGRLNESLDSGIAEKIYESIFYHTPRQKRLIPLLLAIAVENASEFFSMLRESGDFEDIVCFREPTEDEDAFFIVESCEAEV